MSAKTCQICGKRPATATITLAGRPCAVCAPCRKNDWHRETRPGLIPAGKRTQIAGPHVEALVRLLLAGLRVSEAIRVTPEDLTEEGAQVRDGRTASSHRVVPLPAETLRVLRRFPKGIPVVHGLGGKDGRRHAHLAVARLGEVVGVELSPRILTGYAIADQLARGVPVHVVQRNAGHRDIRSTLRYAPEGSGDPVAAAAALLTERFGLEETVAREYVEALRGAGFMAH